MSDYDLLVIGAGPGGYTAAVEASKRGMKTALVEKDQLGGTCLNRGCIPTKTLIHISDLIRDISGEKEAGIVKGKVSCDLPALYERKREVTRILQDGVAELLKKSRVDVIEGKAQVKTPGTVRIQTKEGERLVSTQRILIAAGSRSSRLPVPGADLPGVYYSENFFDQLPEERCRLLVVGGGVIGVEIASIYEALGFEVTILEMLPKLLGPMDRELAQNLAQIMKKRGVRIETGAAVKGFYRDGKELTAEFTQKGTEKEL